MGADSETVPVSEVYHEDWLKMMARFPDKFFDWAVPDFPYGIGASSPAKKPVAALQKNGSRLRVKAPDYGKKKWDTTPPPKEVFDELFRVSKNQIIWGVNYYDYKFGPGRLVWDKLNGESDQMGCEIAYISTSKRTDMVYYMWSGMMQGIYAGRDLRKALVQQGNKKLNEPRFHPTQKPLTLMRYVFREFIEPGSKILDPCMGSQSSRIAAWDNKCDYWGNDIDPDYFVEGNNRFETHKSQLVLF